MDYIFIYKNSLGRFNQATNIKFIASHPKCKAVPKYLFTDAKYMYADFIYDLNTEHELSDKAYNILKEADALDIVY